MDPDLRKKAEKFPNRPGVYIFKDANGDPLYIGKAKNLRKRVLSYFNPNVPDKIKAMLKEARQIDCVVVNSENEALLLEANMIFEEKPPYNTLLKETRVYPFIVIVEDTFPYLKLVREKSIAGEYFGPYSDIGFARELMDLSFKIFKIRSCSIRIDGGRRKVCLEYHLGRCSAPCAGKISREEYMKSIENLKRFLKGDIDEVLEKLRDDMKRMADLLEFEKAGAIRDMMNKILKLLKPQNIVLPDDRKMDVVHFEKGLGVVLKIRNGFMLGKMSYNFDGEISEFLEQLYCTGKLDTPDELIVNLDPSDPSARLLKSALKISRMGPPRDEMENRILEMARMNWEEEFKMMEDVERTLKKLADLLRMGRTPRRIEGMDVSHTHGILTVSSVVVFEDGRPNKREYRRYRFDEIKVPNDFEVIKLTVQRRYSKHDVPDLLLIDGGIQQVRSALEGLKKVGKLCKVLGIVKGEEKLVDEFGNVFNLPMDDDVLRLLIHVRDEAHRFANTLHTKLRDRRLVVSKLEEIPGIGKKRKKRLLEVFKSLNKIAESSVEEIKEVIGSEKLAKKIKEYLGKVVKDAG
ncbi:MAG: excinuclease ABC subunit UvrC [Thermotogae bacterium]|nr:excinuclease ABC subunit UvrC [Thermotogota bacterium]